MTELTFLRPWWLLGLLPAIGLLWLVWQKKVQDSGWKQWIDPAFQPYLLSEQNAAQNAWPLGFFGLAIIWLAAIIALAGPSWNQQPIAAQSTQSGSVILLDLSLSMYADDLQPNRLTRVQFKLTDLLNQHPEIRLGMVGYSASAHIITPISDDNTTLRNLLTHLNPLVMPAYGANALAGFEKAIALFEGAHINQRHLIWVTDDVEPSEVEAIQQQLQQHQIKLSLLAVGTPQGGAIMVPDFGLLKDSQDRLIQAQVPLQRLAELAQAVGGQFSRLQFDDSDLDSLLPPFLAASEREQQDEKQLFQPLDYGVYLLWLLVPLVALAARRGWLMAIAGLVILPSVFLPVSPSFAQTDALAEPAQKPEISLSDRWREMFLTGNQRGYQAWLEQDYLTAEREFSDPSWRGSSLYRQGRFEEAAKAFARDESAQGHYNRANALAKSGELEQAIKAYKTALEMQPDFSQAQHNLKVVEALLSHQQQNAQSSRQDDKAPSSPQQNPPAQDQASDQGEPNDAPSEQTPQSGQQGQNADTAQTGETQGENQSENTQQTTEPQDSAAQQPLSQPQDQALAQQDNPAQADAQNGLINTADEPTSQQQAQQRELDQAQKTWLNQIKDEPGVFLRRKFDYQYQLNPPSAKPSADPQKEQTKLW